MLHGARVKYQILMGPRPHSPADEAAGSPAPAAVPPLKPSMATRRASAPYAERTRGYYHTLSATSIGLEMAIAVVFPLMVGIWLDKKAGTTPWLMLLCLGFGFAAGLRAVWRYVAAADRRIAESDPAPDEARAAAAADGARGRS